MPRVFHLMQFGMHPLLAQSTVGGIADNIVAAGTNQATAVLLTGTNNIVTTAAAGTGVQMHIPSQVTTGDATTVVNLGANALLVYPQTGGSIQGGTVNAGFSIPVGKTAMFIARNPTDYAVNLSA